MGFIPKLIAGLYGIGTVVFVILIVYLIVRRIKIKKTETFGKRDN